MSVTLKTGLPRPWADRSASAQEVLRQLRWLPWLRLVVVSTAFFTTLLLDLVIKTDLIADLNTVPLYALFGGAYVLTALGWCAARWMRSSVAVALVQFGGDIVIETALLQVLGYQGGMAFALMLFFLTTFLACTYLNRGQGALFASGAFLLQGIVVLATHFGWLEGATVTHQPPLGSFGAQQILVNLFVFMFTFHATAWLVASRAERLRRIRGDLADLRAFHEHVVRSMSAALLTTDFRGRITFANVVAERLLGRPVDELRGQRLHEVLAWEQHEQADLEAARGEMPGLRVEREAAFPHGRLEVEVAISQLVDADGEPIGVVFLLEDVTEFRQLEEEVQLKERMAAIGEMAAGIAHEVRNPLASISGSVQMLARSLDLDGDQGRLVDIVLKESSRLDDTITEFLQFARPRRGDPREVNLGELVRETATLLGHSEEVGEQHEVVVVAEPNVLAVVDPDQVRQVVWNLCKNALKAMPDGGQLRVTAERADGEAVLCVEDSGVGMSAEARARAFQPLVGDFEQGMGMGLAIVYRIVKDHDGHVFIDSVPGRGTRIEVRLPAPAASPGGEAR